MLSFVNKLTYKNDKSEKILERPKPVITHKKVEVQEVSPIIKRRENTIISILLSGDLSIFEIIKQNIKPEDFQDKINHEIAKKLYEEFEKGNSNINGIIDELDQEEQNQITMIMADDYEIDDLEKAIDDIIQTYQKEKLNNRKFEILELMEQTTDENQKKELEKELSNIIIRLASIK